MAGKLRLCGYRRLVNDQKGQFQANWATPHSTRALPAPILAIFREISAFPRGFRELYSLIFSLLERELNDAGFHGPLGIDAFVYRGVDGKPRLKPIVEINPRYTMGRLTLELMRQTCPGSHGLFRLVSRAKARQEGFEDFTAFAQALTEKFPLRFEGQPALKIYEGAVCLNDPSTAQACLAVFQVSPILMTSLARFS